MFPGRGNAGSCAVMLYVGEGPRGNKGARSTLHQISVTPSTIHNQIGPLWCCFPSGWACAHPRPPWVSPTTSPVRLGVSPAAVPTPTGVFKSEVWGFISPSWSLGLRRLLRSPTFTPVYLCTSVGPQGLLVVRLPAPFIPHSARLGPPRTRESSPPQCPSPPLLPVWMYVSFLFPWCRTSLPLDFLSVLVVRGGAVCLPMLPSWFSPYCIFIHPETSSIQVSPRQDWLSCSVRERSCEVRIADLALLQSSYGSRDWDYSCHTKVPGIEPRDLPVCLQNFFTICFLMSSAIFDFQTSCKLGFCLLSTLFFRRSAGYPSWVYEQVG